MSDLAKVLFLTMARLSFPHIAEPQKQQGENGERVSYNADLIISPNDPKWAQLHQMVFAMATEKWKDQAAAVINHVNQDRKKRGYAAGHEKVNGKTLKVYEGYEGNVVITAGSQKQPQIIDAQGNPIDPANTMACQNEARRMYGGCYVNAAIKPWLQENKHGRGIRFDLVAVQFAADGTPFGEGHVDVTGMFAATGAAPAFGAMMPGPAPAVPSWMPPQVPGMPAAPFPVQQAAPPAFLSPPVAAPGLPPFLQ